MIDADIENRGEHSAVYRLSLAVVDRVDKPEVVDDCVLGGSVVADGRLGVRQDVSDVSDVSGGIWRGGLVRRQDVHLEEGVGVVEDNVDLGLLDRGYDTWASGHIKQPQRSCQGASRSNKGAIKELSRSIKDL